jgi:hypothetical protein
MAIDIDISDSFTWEEGLPRPQWDLLGTWVESKVDPAEHMIAWSEIARQWLQTLQPELGDQYCLHEAESVLLLSAMPADQSGFLLRFGQRCQRAIPSGLPGVAEFPQGGKQVVVALADEEQYYQYISVYYPQGHHGSSAGVHVREGYPHVALCGDDLAMLENTLAHELTHASLQHLTMPQWIEEGLAQLYEHTLSGRGLLLLDPEMAAGHKMYWKKHGLDGFWRGEGFSQPGRVQKLSYQLAEILMRLLGENYRPRWLGLDKSRLRQLLQFLRDSHRDDCGEAAAREHLHCGLSEVARQFLGPGDWSVGL